MSTSLSDKVYKKDFTKREVGYDAREVDSFLDDVNIEIRKLERENEFLKKQIESLNASLTESQNDKILLRAEITKLESASNTKSSYNNIEIIQRLSHIENELIKLNKDKQ